MSQEESNFIYEPKDSVIGVFDTPEKLQATIEDLNQAGFSSDNDGIAVLCGEEGVQQIDLTGKRHGLLARIVRTVQNLANELDYAVEVVKEMEAGRYVLRVHADTHETREQVKGIFEAHQAHHISLFGKLGPGSG